MAKLTPLYYLQTKTEYRIYILFQRSSISTRTEHHILYAYLSHVKAMECQLNYP